MNKKVILSILLTFWGVILFAQCVSGNCENGSGIFIFPSGAKYIGQFKNNQINGVGSFYYTDGSKYQGEWIKGRPHGKGIKVLVDGTKEQGIWDRGKLMNEKQMDLSEVIGRGGWDKKQSGCVSGNCKNGKGIYIYPSGAVYIGDFRDGEIHGVGVCYYSDGSKYQGNWVHRYPQGKGTKIFADGTSHTGTWKKGQPVDEMGNLIDIVFNSKASNDDGTAVQSGCISGNCMNGEGIYAYPDGSRYEGYFRSGKPELGGTFHYPNGDRYVGAFKSGYPHGHGSLYHADGSISSGEWKEGEFQGKRYSEEGNLLGCIEGDCKNGYGTYIFRDGARYIGAFQDALPHGRGKVFYQNGERYEGQMAKASFNGQGTLYLKDGTKVNGYWKDGTYIGVQDPNVGQDRQTVLLSPQFNKAQFNPKLKVWAVIIGIASYNHMPVLRYTDDDAYQMYAFFKSPEGGALDDDHIRILINEEATKSNIKNTMLEVFGKAGKNDLVVLYFSGHGLKGSFLPIDYDGYNNKILHDEINDILKKSPAKYKLCIADACHSGSLLAMRSGKVPDALHNYYKTLARAAPGTALIMSSKSDETSLESSGLRHGVFSHFLIRGLKGQADDNGDKIVSVQELFDFVNTNVRAYTGNRQSPLIQGDYDKKMPVAVRR